MFSKKFNKLFGVASWINPIKPQACSEKIAPDTLTEYKVGDFAEEDKLNQWSFLRMAVSKNAAFTMIKRINVADRTAYYVFEKTEQEFSCVGQIYEGALFKDSITRMVQQYDFRNGPRYFVITDQE